MSILLRGHPHRTYAQKSPKLDPPPVLLDFYSDSSFRHSQFLGYFQFYLFLGLIFTKPILKRFLWFLFIA